MHKFLLSLCAFSILALYGQTHSITDIDEIRVNYDEFEDVTITSIPYEYIPIGETEMCLELRQVKTSDGTAWYWMCINYENMAGQSENWIADWFFIQDGYSLIFLADGEKIPLMVVFGDMERDYGTEGSGLSSVNWVSEWVPYRVTADQLKKIAFANEVKARILGDPYYDDVTLTQDNLKMMRLFYDAVVAGKWEEIVKQREAEAKVAAESWRRLTDSLFVQSILGKGYSIPMDSVRAAIAKCEQYGWPVPPELTAREEEQKKIIDEYEKAKSH